MNAETESDPLSRSPSAGARAVLSNPLQRGVGRLLRPVDRFIRGQTSGAVLLLAAAAAALVMVNSSWAPAYEALSGLQMGLFVGDFSIADTLHYWFNDGLMVLFFFLLGLEVKREFIAGELSRLRQSGAVVIAAIGGMALPALLYTLINHASEGVPHGWGIPMATDTAFALGALALLGRRVSASVKTFLVALAIVDDIGAILVIALFYTKAIDPTMLAWAGLAFAALIALNVVGVRSAWAYLAVSLLLWYAVLQSGVHATVAGVLAALAIPARPRVHPRWFARRIRRAARVLDGIDDPHRAMLADRRKHVVVERINLEAHDSMTPLRAWERTLERPVSLLVVPIFAFLNAGIVVSTGALGEAVASHVGLGVLVGLVVGKPLGIVLATWLALKLKLGELPGDATTSDVVGIGLLAGMGFTMSIFMGVLSLGGDQAAQVHAKTAVMLATLLAGIAGFAWFRFIPGRREAAAGN